LVMVILAALALIVRVPISMRLLPIDEPLENIVHCCVVASKTSVCFCSYKKGD